MPCAVPPRNGSSHRHAAARIVGTALLTPVTRRKAGALRAALDPEAVSTAVTVAASTATAAATAGGAGPLAALGNKLTSVLVLAAIIAVHELGHFIGARSQGIRVKNFSIGFGPSLVSVKDGPEDDEDAIEYTIRAIPAGGFVSFPQHYEVDQDGEIIR